MPGGTVITPWEVSLPPKKNEQGQIVDMGETMSAEVYFKRNPDMIEHMIWPERDPPPVSQSKSNRKVAKSFLFFPGSALTLGTLSGFGGYYISAELIGLTSQILIGLSTSAGPILGLVVFCICMVAYMQSNRKGSESIDIYEKMPSPPEPAVSLTL